MFECLQAAADQRLPEFIAEIRRAVRRFDQDVFGGLVQPLAGFGLLFPFASAVQPRVSGRSGYRERPLAAGDPVADLAAGSGRRAVERLDGRREVVRFGLDRNDALELLDLEIVRRVVGRRGELFGLRAL